MVAKVNVHMCTYLFICLSKSTYICDSLGNQTKKRSRYQWSSQKAHLLHVILLVNVNSMSLKVPTCNKSLVTLAAEAIIRLCVCLSYVSQSLL